MAYIPHWTENPAFQQGFQGFLQNIAKGIAPDFYARQTFQQMVQQDPTLVEEISNMDDGARATFATALGAKNKNPLEKIGIGAKRQERERIAGIRKTLTPEQQAIANARDVGTAPQSDIDYQKIERERAGTTFKTNQEAAARDALKDKYSLDRLAKDAEAEEAAIKAYPEMRTIDVKAVVEDLMDGTIDPVLAQRIKGNAGLSLAVEKRIDTREKEIAAAVRDREIRLSAELTKDRQVAVKAMSADDTGGEAKRLGTAYTKRVAGLNSAIAERAKLIASDKNLKGFESLSPEMQQKMLKMINPQTRAQLEAIEQRIAEQKETVDLIGNAYQSALKLTADTVKAGQEAAAATQPKPLQIKVNENPPESRAATVAQRIEQGAMTLDAALADARVPEATKAWLKRRYGR